MFTARGAALTRLPSGLVQVNVEFFADADPQHPILTQTYVVVDKDALIVKVSQQLTALKQAQDEATQQFNVVGVLLGEI